MKKVFGTIVVLSVMASCNDNASAEQEIDSLEKKVEVGWDSTKAEVRELRDSLKGKWKRRKDSTDTDSVRIKS